MIFFSFITALLQQFLNKNKGNKARDRNPGVWSQVGLRKHYYEQR